MNGKSRTKRSFTPAVRYTAVWSTLSNSFEPSTTLARLHFSSATTPRRRYWPIQKHSSENGPCHELFEISDRVRRSFFISRFRSPRKPNRRFPSTVATLTSTSPRRSLENIDRRPNRLGRSYRRHLSRPSGRIIIGFQKPLRLSPGRRAYATPSSPRVRGVINING